MDAEPIAITGASGRLGGRVAERLADQGYPLRLIVRDEAKAPSIPDAEIAVVAGGYPDEAGMTAALTGTTTMLLVSASEHPHRAAQHLSAIDAAHEARVERVIYTSFARAMPHSAFTFAHDHFATEQALRRYPSAFVVARNSMFMEMLPTMVGDDGVIRGPAGSGVFFPISRDDVAECLVRLLTDESTNQQTFELAGPQQLRMADIAAIIGDVTGREITYVDETVEEAYAWRDGMATAWEVTGWVSSYRAIAEGEYEGLGPDDVRNLIDRSPVRFEDWLRANPDTWAHLRA